MIATGSRPAASSRTPWLRRGTSRRAARPAAGSIADAKPPSRRDAILRIGIVVGVLVIVFGIILPRFIDYQQVIKALQGLTIEDVLIVSVFGLIAWILTGAIFTALIPGLGP